MFMAGEVPTELHTLPVFGFELQLDELFDGLLASSRSVTARIYIEFVVHAHLVDDQGSDGRPFVHVHDLTTLSLYRVRLGRLPSGRIGCHL